MSCPYTPEQNGKAERKHRHIVELGLSMMFHSNTPLHYWVEAFFTANYIVNLLPSQTKKSPHERLFQNKPDYSMLRVFGSACYPCLRPVSQHKFDPRSLQCVFLGYNSQYKGYRCLYPPTGKVYISRHVLFGEDDFPFKTRYQKMIPAYQTALLKSWQMASPRDKEKKEDSPIQLLPRPTQEEANHQPQDQDIQQDHLSDNDEGNIHNQIEAEPEVGDQNAHPMTTRSKAGITKPNSRYVMLASKFTPEEPRNIDEAMKHPAWTDPAPEKIRRIHMLKTWTLVPRTPDMHVLHSQWLFTTKLNPDGTTDKRKVRLVAKGNKQEEGVDYLETFSPVVRTATIRLVLKVATTRKWPIKQLDVSNAFLHGDLKEPVYMFQPAGFINPNKPSHVCCLSKALYGLKQAPRAWFDTFSNFLLEFGFECSKSDPSLFTYPHKEKTLLLLLYVDDILLTGNSEHLIQDLLKALNTRFSMKHLGKPKYFLGIQIEETEEGLFLHQEGYAKDILHQAGMSDCNPMPTPLPIVLDR